MLVQNVTGVSPELSGKSGSEEIEKSRALGATPALGNHLPAKVSVHASGQKQALRRHIPWYGVRPPGPAAEILCFCIPAKIQLPKKILYLQSQNGNGPVAQLNRVFDYGSKGSRFESWRGHIVQ